MPVNTIWTPQITTQLRQTPQNHLIRSPNSELLQWEAYHQKPTCHTFNLTWRSTPAVTEHRSSQKGIISTRFIIRSSTADDFWAHCADIYSKTTSRILKLSNSFSEILFTGSILKYDDPIFRVQLRAYSACRRDTFKWSLSRDDNNQH